MVRELADYNYDRYEQIMRWPVREALEAMAAKKRAQALEAYRFERLLYTIIAPHWDHKKKKLKAPELPDILKS